MAGKIESPRSSSALVGRDSPGRALALTSWAALAGSLVLVISGCGGSSNDPGSETTSRSADASQSSGDEAAQQRWIGDWKADAIIFESQGHDEDTGEVTLSFQAWNPAGHIGTITGDDDGCVFDLSTTEVVSDTDLRIAVTKTSDPNGICRDSTDAELTFVDGSSRQHLEYDTDESGATFERS